jgi:surface glycoprotein (TIGR04207 family)/PGF-CTERM protein
MTGTNDKLRGLLLAVLMVTSVFAGTIAFAGTVAAVANEEVEADSGPVEFFNPNDDNTQVEIILSQDFETATNAILIFDGDTLVANSAEGDAKQGTAPFVTSPNSGTEFTAGEQIVLSLDSGSDLTRDATLALTNGAGSSAAGNVFKEFDITTTSSTVADGNNAVVYDGEQIAVLTSDGINDYEFFDEDGAFVFSGSTSANSQVNVEDSDDSTTNLLAGQTYTVEFGGDATNNAEIQVRSLGLSIAADDTSVTFDPDSTGEINTTVSSNVADRNVNVSVFDEDGDLETSNAQINLDGLRTVNVSFSNLDEGNYTVQVEDLATGITDETGTISVSEGTDAEPSFTQSVYTDERGDVIEFTVDLDDADQATVEVGGATGQSNIGYSATFTIEDDSDDGEVTVQLNTFRPRVISTADDDDTITTSGNAFAGTDEVLDAATYDVSVNTVGGSETDVAAISLVQNAPEAFTLYTGADVSDVQDADSLADVSDLKDAGSVTESSRIASGDTLIHEIEISGLEGALDDQTGSDAEDLFNSLINSGNVELSIIQTESSIGPNQNPKALIDTENRAENVPSASNVIADGDNDTYYLNFPVAIGTGTNGSDVEADDQFDVTLTITEASGLVNENTSVSRTFTVVERDVELDTTGENPDGTEFIQVESADGQTVTGDTTLAPGTELSVRARATGDSPFLKSQTVTVDDSRSFSAEFSFASVSEGQNFTISVIDGSTERDDVDAVVSAAPTATVAISDQTGAGDTVTVDSVTLSEGGFVTIHDNTLADDAVGSVVGTSDYLAAGSYSNIEITLDTPLEEDQTVTAMPHQDTDGDQTYDFVSSGGADDAPYVGDDGNAVTAQAAYTLEAEETDAPETDAPETDAPETDAPETDAPETDAPETDAPETTTATDGQPGFGVIVALLAFLAAALIAIRRD